MFSIAARSGRYDAAPMRWLVRSAGLLLAASFGFVLTAEAVRPHVPIPDGDALAARFEHLAQSETRYDVVVIGQSTVLRAFDPDAFDREAAAQGHELRSFNLGVPGAFQFEIDYLLEQLVERAARPPRFVFVELPTRRLDELLPPVNHFTDRAVYWHAPRQTRAWFRSVARSSHPERGGTRRIDVLQHAAWRWASVGQADRTTGHALSLGAAERAAEVREVERTRGYRPFRLGPDTPHSDLRDQLLRSPRWFRGVVARIDDVNQGKPTHRVLDPAWVRLQSEKVRAGGATLVHFITPTILQTAELHTLHRAGVIPELFAFDSPHRFPELYRRKNRFDPIHLNEDGARLFSVALARSFASWLDSGDG